VSQFKDPERWWNKLQLLVDGLISISASGFILYFYLMFNVLILWKASVSKVLILILNLIFLFIIVKIINSNFKFYLVQFKNLIKRQPPQLQYITLFVFWKIKSKCVFKDLSQNVCLKIQVKCVFENSSVNVCLKFK